MSVKKHLLASFAAVLGLSLSTMTVHAGNPGKTGGYVQTSPKQQHVVSSTVVQHTVVHNTAPVLQSRPVVVWYYPARVITVRPTQVVTVYPIQSVQLPKVQPIKHRGSVTTARPQQSVIQKPVQRIVQQPAPAKMQRIQQSVSQKAY